METDEPNRARRKTDNEVWDYIEELKANAKRIAESNFYPQEYKSRELDQIAALIYALEWTIGAVKDARTGEYL